MTSPKSLRDQVARALCEAAGDDPDAMVYPFKTPSRRRKGYVMHFDSAYPGWHMYAIEADAALALILEAAAKVAEEAGGPGGSSYENGFHMGARRAASRIRALK